jgi:glycosyl transferase family 87
LIAALSRLNPNVVLVASAFTTVLIEAFGPTRAARYGPECGIAALALAVAWLSRHRLDTRVLVVLAVALPAAISLAHLARGIAGDGDVRDVYPAEGGSLLHGTYPHSEYPPGAVLLFAFETWSASARSMNPFVMAACQGAVAWAIASLRPGDARWLAGAVAIWPVNAFFWEFKFDALPAALLVVGLLFALRERWVASGALLGLGAAVKWTPGLSFLIVVLWLVAVGRPRDALRHSAAFAVAAAVVVGPFLAWAPGAVWSSVTRQAPRGLTPESFWYLPLHALGRASQPGQIYDAAAVSARANHFVVAVQVLTIAALAAFVIRRRPSLSGAVAAAATAPVLFLLLNKVFSAQYILVIMAAGFMAAVLVGRSLPVGVLLLVGAVGNLFVYPLTVQWRPASAVLFACALVSVLVILRGIERSKLAGLDGAHDAGSGSSRRLRGKDSNLDYLIQSQASYH